VEVRVKPELPDGDRSESAGTPRPWDVPSVEGSDVGSVPEAVRDGAPGADGEPVPDVVRDAARRAFDAGAAVAEVADLLFDSVLDEDPAGLLFADRHLRRLHFAAPDSDRGARMTASDDGDSVAITLQVLPPTMASAEVRSKGPTFTVRTDDNGVIRFDVPPGLVSVVITPVHSLWPRPLQTAWVRL
jgi:hypothetical protein